MESPRNHPRHAEARRHACKLRGFSVHAAAGRGREERGIRAYLERR